MCVSLNRIWQPHLSLKTKDKFLFNARTQALLVVCFHCDGFVGWLRTLVSQGTREGR